MKPIVIIAPAMILVGGLVMFIMAPLGWTLRTVILLSDIFCAGLVGWILWRRQM